MAFYLFGRISMGDLAQIFGRYLIKTSDKNDLLQAPSVDSVLPKKGIASRAIIGSKEPLRNYEERAPNSARATDLIREMTPNVYTERPRLAAS